MGYVSGCWMNSPQAICPVTGRISSAFTESYQRIPEAIPHQENAKMYLKKKS